MGRQEKKITFPLYLSFMPPSNKRWDGGRVEEAFFRRHPGGFAARQTGTRRSMQPLLVFPPFIRAANLWPHHNDQSFPSLHGPSWCEDEEDSEEDEDLTIWIEVGYGVHQYKTTEREHLVFDQVFFFSAFLCPFPRNMILSGFFERPFPTQCLNVVNYLKGKVCTCWKPPIFGRPARYCNANKKQPW